METNAISATTGTSLTTSLLIESQTDDSLTLSYSTMPGNQPSTYGNYIALWRNMDTIPWNSSSPTAKQAIASNVQSGSLTFTGLSLADSTYIVGYAVGPTLSGSGMQVYGNICTTAYQPVSGSTMAAMYTTPSLSVMYIGTTSLTVEFKLPDGLTPKTNGAWLGLWRSSAPSYTTLPMATTSINIDSSQGSASFSKITMTRGTTYTVGLFMSAGQKSLACSVTFTT